MRLFYRPLIATLVLLVARPSLLGQIVNVSNSTATPTAGVGRDYIKQLQETVDPASGSLSVRIGVPVPPGRGLTLPFAFSYDSNSASLVVSQPGRMAWSYNRNIFANGSWSNTLPSLTSALVQWQDPSKPNPPPCFASTGYMFQDASGARHSLGLSAILNAGLSPSCLTSHWTNYFTGGDDFLQATLSGYITTTSSGPGEGEVRIAQADATVYDFANSVNPGAWNCSVGSIGDNTFAAAMPRTIEDRNGNTITISSPCAGNTFSISDTTGRTALSFTATANSSAGGFNSYWITGVSVSGLSQPYNVAWSTGSYPQVSLNATAINGNNGCNGVPNWNSIVPGPQFTQVTAITLPNGKQYQFNYDPTYGALSKITYPDGGYVSYTWGLNPQSAEVSYTSLSGQAYSCQYVYDRPAILHRYVSFDGTTVALQQDFAYSTTWTGQLWATKQTTVTTHDLVRGTATFQTIYSYSPILVPQIPNVSPPYSPYTNYADRQLPVETTVTYKGFNGAVLRTVSKHWIDQYELGCEVQTLDSGAISGSFYTYGPGHVITDKKEYDFGILTPSNCPVVPTNTSTRETITTYQGFASTPIYPGSPSILDEPATVSTYGNGTLLAQTNFTYDQYTQFPLQPVANLPAGTHDETNYSATSTQPRGNATTVTRKCLQTCTDAVTTNTFDETGQLLSKTDPCGNATCADMTGTNHTTSFSYADSYDSPPSSNTNAYLTQITDPLGHTTKFEYAYSDGKVIQSTDQNSLITGYLYADSLRRLTETDFPDSGSIILSYNDVAPTPSITTSKKINSAQTLTSVAIRDGFGHVTHTQLTSDPQGTVYTDVTYDGLGRVYTASNPYRSGTDITTTSGTTTYGYDALSRKTSETYPDNSVLTTAYCGASTLVTDPTGKWRRSRGDALGRLVEVDEPNAVGATVNPNGCVGTGEPIWVTSYTNDALGNLTQVVQNGSHTRTFAYDSLSRMLTSNSPEVGTLTYTYDANNNVSTKKDARLITTTYGYDVLNREKTVTYSNSDPGISINYDEATCLTGVPQCNNIGHRTSMTDAAGSEIWAYDVPDRIHKEQRTTSGITKSTTYNLDYAGNVTSVVYPTGRTVNFAYDSADRPSSAADGSNGITYATGFKTSPGATCLANVTCYTPQGTFYALSIGQSSSFTNGLNLTHIYNSRLQPNEFKASSAGGNAIDISYNFVDPVSGKNAGHVYGITNNIDTTRSQVFTYDQLNRITSALTTSTHATSPTHCWGETYSLDAWANLQSIAQTTNPSYTGCTGESGFSATANGNNHLSGLTYDSSGNTLTDGANTYTWDGESQLKSAAGVNYLYDGDGRRVSKSNGKLYWYGSGDEILAETNASGTTTAEYIFFGGKRVAMLPAGANPIYYIEDLLGTSRVTTSNTGVVCYDADYYPYGGERAYTNTCPQNYKFEGKERDTETGNDDFGARYYSNLFGRWLSADWSNVPVPVPYANLTNPQTLNLYSMVADDPESFADLDGHFLNYGRNVTGYYIDADCFGSPDWKCFLQANANDGNSQSQQAAQNQQQQTQAQAQNQNQNQQNQQQSTAPANSRTDVVLYGREYTPTPQRSTAFLWEMDWYAGSCSGDKCSQSAANQKQTISLVEKVGNGEWKPTGDPIKGVAHDQISPEPKTFNQHWFVDGKQVQLVVGKDSKGNLIKTWEVHVVINKTGDRPVYSPVP